MSVPPKITVGFRIKYWTEWGQNLVVCGNDPRLGSWDVRKGVFMRCQVSARARSLAAHSSSAAAARAPFLSNRATLSRPRYRSRPPRGIVIPRTASTYSP
ncbi:hypothetical protein N9M16_06640 [Candidatus Dependentiae bacterium]|nr:hypothetical protein [Candidatus Dependentiae bacterium]